jgi:hypothetical protein
MADAVPAPSLFLVGATRRPIESTAPPPPMGHGSSGGSEDTEAVIVYWRTAVLKAGRGPDRWGDSLAPSAPLRSFGQARKSPGDGRSSRSSSPRTT